MSPTPVCAGGRTGPHKGSSDYFEKPPSSFLSSIPGYKTGLLAPYGVWVCFAAVLNDEIWRLNR